MQLELDIYGIIKTRKLTSYQTESCSVVDQ